MEQIGVFLDEEWESLSKVFTFEEAQLNNWSFENLSNSWPIFDDNTNMNVNERRFNSSDAFVSNFHYFPQESGNNGGGFISHSQGSESNIIIDPVVFSINEIEDKSKSSLNTYFSDDCMGEIFFMNEDIPINMLGNENGQLKRKLTMPPLINCSQDMTNTESFSMISKKNPRVSVDIISKKNKKIISNSDASSYDSMIKEGKKGRASGGVAESQSVYARKRRDKINERLKTLQKLVPSGTKVDISTMLDEAVHYVKFLQLQIKLLSSDDKWMYAPIAYNGMDSGLHSTSLIQHHNKGE